MTEVAIKNNRAIDERLKYQFGKKVIANYFVMDIHPLFWFKRVITASHEALADKNEHSIKSRTEIR